MQPEGEYWGLAAICRRMGWKDRETPLRQLERYAFPMFQRHRKGHLQPIWWTCEPLIRWWYFTRIKAARDSLLQRRASRAKPR